MEDIKRVQLSEIAGLITKGTTPTTLGYEFQEDGVNFLKIECFDENGGFIESKVAHISEECNEKLKRSQLKAGDVLFSIAGAIGRVAIVTEEMLPANTNQALAIIRIADEQVYLPYIKLILTSPIVIEQFEKKKQGVAQLNLSLKDINEISIPLPSKEKQIELAELFDKVAGVIAKRKTEISALDDLIKARFVEMFGDIQHEEKYKGIQLRDLCTTMSGGTPSTKFPEYYEGDIPWISTVSLGPNHIDGSNAKAYITQDAIDNSATKLIPAGNILFGTRVGVGKSSLNDVDICTNQDIVAIIGIDESRFKRLFIKHVLDAYKPYYDSIKKGATILGITGDDLKDTLIPDVPIEVQIEYETFVNQVDKSKFANMLTVF
ncbi:MAG: restriction endonuclease subunit S [Butyrivibrio sp.]